MKKQKIALTLTILLLLTNTAMAEEQFNHGEKWLKSSVGEKMNYMSGYFAGYTMGVMNSVKQFMPVTTDQEKEAAYSRAAMIFGDRRVGNDLLADIVIVMDNMYKDEKNTYINRTAILELAFSALRGQNINDDLARQRKVVSEEGKNK